MIRYSQVGKSIEGIPKLPHRHPAHTAYHEMFPSDTLETHGNAKLVEVGTSISWLDSIRTPTLFVTGLRVRAR